MVGFYAADGSVVRSKGQGGEFFPVLPERMLDSRAFGSGGKLLGDEYYRVPVDFAELNSTVKAFAVNITAVSPNGGGFLSAWNGSSSEFPSTSTLNYTAGRNVSNMAIVPTSRCWEEGCSGEPMIGVLNTASGSTSTHVIVDIVGVYDDGSDGNGLRFRPITPTRITDTRTGLGYPTALGKGVTATAAVAGDSTYALAFNVTAVSPTADTYLALWPKVDGLGKPDVSPAVAGGGSSRP